MRGFLGLTCYYRKFIKDFGILSSPLTLLLKKDNFQWSSDAEATFQSLKKVWLLLQFWLGPIFPNHLFWRLMLVERVLVQFLCRIRSLLPSLARPLSWGIKLYLFMTENSLLLLWLFKSGNLICKDTSLLSRLTSKLWGTCWTRNLWTLLNRGDWLSYWECTMKFNLGVGWRTRQLMPYLGILHFLRSAQQFPLFLPYGFRRWFRAM